MSDTRTPPQYPNGGAPKMEGWNVYRKGKLADTVFYIKGTMTADEVRESLIDHDSYPSDITVHRSKI